MRCFTSWSERVHGHIGRLSKDIQRKAHIERPTAWRSFPELSEYPSGGLSRLISDWPSPQAGDTDPSLIQNIRHVRRAMSPANPPQFHPRRPDTSRHAEVDMDAGRRRTQGAALLPVPQRPDSCERLPWAPRLFQSLVGASISAAKQSISPGITVPIEERASESSKPSQGLQAWNSESCGGPAFPTSFPIHASPPISRRNDCNISPTILFLERRHMRGTAS